MRKLLVAFLVVYCATLVLLWFQLLAAAPAVTPDTGAIQPAELERLHAALRQQLRLQNDGSAEISLGEPDINRLATHLLRQQDAPLAVEVELHDGYVEVPFSLDTELPRPWVNGRVTLTWREQMPHLQSARLGAVPVPEFLLPALERMALGRLRQHASWASVEQLLAAVQQLTITEETIHARFALASPLRTELAARQGELLFGPAVQRRTPHFAALLGQALAGRREAPLESVLPPLFAGADGADADTAAIDNRALLLAVTLHSVPSGTLRHLGGADLADIMPRESIRLTLHGRRDLAQHFLISALLASYGDEALASRAGLYKELQDMQTQSGFDATDLLADYAGMAFGSLAANQALWLQQWMAQGVAAARPADALMPAPAALAADQRAALQEAAAAADLDTLERLAEREVLPLLATTRLLQEAP